MFLTEMKIQLSQPNGYGTSWSHVNVYTKRLFVTFSKKSNSKKRKIHVGRKLKKKTL